MTTEEVQAKLASMYAERNQLRIDLGVAEARIVKLTEVLERVEDEAHAAILKLIKEMVPEEPWVGDYKDCPAAWINSSYKAFRKEFLDRLEEREKP